ncbi:hypothetical protein [Sediminibacillus terrae]|uniref:hypothetical protein n=1 Tax=Sediminibacillus terrae TaxID=1562106 RepID=UPI001296145C|nr:hypothetical protein [Sediminibacillus terrae]
MKKFLLSILMISLAVLFTACSESDTDKADQDTSSADEETAETKEAGSSDVKPGDIEITDEIKDMTYSTMEEYDGVKDAYIEVDGDQITMTLQVGASLNEEKRKELGDNFVRNLSSNTSFYYDELEGPEKDSYGTLFEIFDLQIGVGPGSEDILQGAKVTSGKSIMW